jgi:hypothetical protein
MCRKEKKIECKRKGIFIRKEKKARILSFLLRNDRRRFYNRHFCVLKFFFDSLVVCRLSKKRRERLLYANNVAFRWTCFFLYWILHVYICFSQIHLHIVYVNSMKLTGIRVRTKKNEKYYWVGVVNLDSTCNTQWQIASDCEVMMVY